jgi:hypothetical protein
MAHKDFLDGLLNRPGGRIGTADNLAGRIARDKQGGTNHTGWNPRPKGR